MADSEVRTLVVDVHSHHYPADFVAACRQGRGGFTTRTRSDGGLAVLADGAVVLVIPQPVPSLADRLAVLDAAGIDVQIVSLSAPNVYPLPAGLAEHVARSANDEFVEMAAVSDGRVKALVSLPLPDVDASLREL